MPKKVKNILKIKPKSDNKTGKVLFSITNRQNKHKGSANKINTSFDLLNFIKKNIQSKIAQNFLHNIKNKTALTLSNIYKDKGFRYFLYNTKYFFRKYVVSNVLNFFYKVLSSLIRFFGTINKNKKVFFRDIKKIGDSHVKFNFIQRLKYFFTPDVKLNWTADFKRFIVLTVATVFVMNIIFFSDQIAKDLEKIAMTTVYAEDQITSGVKDVRNLDTEIAKNKFYLALNSFYNLNQDLSFITKGTFNIVGKLANIQTSDLEEILNNLQNISQSSIKLVDQINLNKDNNFLFKTQKANEFLISIDKDINNINKIVNSINTSLLPDQYKTKLENLKNKVATISSNSNKILQASYLLKDILGDQGKKRYLLVFQNANELRATGGFMGSYALIDMQNGAMVKTEVPGGGTYDLQGGFYKNIEPPMPFKILVKKWEIQDANWFLDFTKSSKKISEFFESAAGGSSVDGIIAINSNILSELLDLTGEIYLEKYDITLSKDNVVDQIQDIISSKRNKTNKPKDIIADLFSAISNKLFDINSDNILNSIAFINNSIEKKQILTNFSDPKDQEIAKFLNISGEIKESSQDYLSIVDTNIGGGKTSQNIKRSVNQSIKILPTGEVLSSVTMSRENLNKDGSDRNIEFIRLYAPSGSILVSSSGFSEDIKIEDYLDVSQLQDKDLDNINKYSVKDVNTNTISYNDEGKTIFGNFVYLDSGDNKDFNITYKLPFKVDYNKINNGKDSYYLYIQSQPGVENINFSLDIKTLEKDLYNQSFVLSSDKIININK